MTSSAFFNHYFAFRVNPRPDGGEFLRQNCFCKITVTATKIVLKVKEA